MSAFIQPPKPGVVHYVRDLKLAAEWYRDTLGFEIGPHDYASFVEMHLDDQYIFHLTPASESYVPHTQPLIWFSSLDIEQTDNRLIGPTAGATLLVAQWYGFDVKFIGIDGQNLANR